MKNITLIATCAFGLENILKQEILDLGFKNLTVSDGKIELTATLSDIPCLNIRLRVADRVLLKLAEYPASDFDQLFDHAKTIAWEDWITKEGKITVTGKSVRSKLESVRTCQSMIKKAIVNRFKDKYKIDWLSEKGPEFTVQIALFKDIALLTLDTTGPGLNKRGYRVSAGEAPIRENLAAALVLLSSWDKGKVLIDPMCGSGTILIEAVMIGRKIAPGLNRTFASQVWPSIPKQDWENAKRAAKKEILPESILKIRGYDYDRARIKDALANAKKCGIQNDITFEYGAVQNLQLKEDAGVVVTNPPYGIHIGEAKDLPPLYAELNKVFESKPGWALYLLTADKSFSKLFHRPRPDKIRKLYNGPMEVQYYSYHAPH